jgi:predicted thioesterase
MIDVEEYLAVGQNAIIRKVVQKSDAAGNYSNGLHDLLATPSCIDMVIKASVEAVNKYLPEGYITIGRAVEFSHDHPSMIGMAVNVKATLREIDGKRLLFDITAWDELGDVGHGTHERIVVLQEEVTRKAKERAKFLVQRNF